MVLLLRFILKVIKMHLLKLKSFERMTELTCLLRQITVKVLRPICGYVIKFESLLRISRKESKVKEVVIIQLQHIWYSLSLLLP